MPRSIQLSLAPEKADQVLQRLDGVEGVAGLSRQRGVSIDPPGDILEIHTCNDTARTVFRILEDLDVADGGSILVQQPNVMIARPHQETIDRESNEATWDEMAVMLREDTNLAINYLLLMGLAGAIAAAGLWADTLHIVVGAMIIAPAFEPLVRIPVGWIAGPREMISRGLLSAASGYGMLILGGLITLLVVRAVDTGADSDLRSRQWVGYWSSFSAPGVLASLFAATAGAVVVSGLRSVLTTGVMIALALIPSMSLVGMALGVGDWSLAGRALARWAVDAALVLGVSTIVIGLKQKFLHRRKAIN